MNHLPACLRWIGTAACLAALVAWTGCGSDRPPVDDAPDAPDPDTVATGPGSWPDATACDPMPGQAAPGGEVVLALGEAVDPAHAPVPRDHAERIVFANLYETLTRVGCDGRLAPGLAASWRRLDDGRRWRLELRRGAVFWDGTPVTPAAVVSAWERNERLARLSGRPCPGYWLASGSRGLAVVGPRTLEIRLAEPQEHLPRLLAHPALAVTAVRDGWRWPVGSGPCRLAADTEQPLPDLVCRPNDHHPEPPVWDELRFRILPDRDPRDLLGDGVDLAVVRDRRAASYYDGRDGVASAPLPWDRLYVLLVPPGAPGLGAEASLLARGAGTPAEHRPWSRLDFHGCRDRGCPQLHGPTVGVFAPPLDPDPALAVLRARQLHHLAADPDARSLAERLAAFAGADLTLVGERDLDLAAALQLADGAGYVVRVDACYPDACLTVASLLARADWLQQQIGEGHDACAVASRLVDEGLAIPLIQTRARLVWRGPLAGLRLAHDGTPLVSGLGRTRPEATP
jgi:hypothetical protein